ncbi:hypothetical protein WJX84_012095 [Apatococcus fuscideae]|uniref:Uncharacterized protein n=1 Tax=Apatococcus fuscideae TaxID=2026836 RepID=A0AAW1T0N2_9CHLO
MSTTVAKVGKGLHTPSKAVPAHDLINQPSSIEPRMGLPTEDDSPLQPEDDMDIAPADKSPSYQAEQSPAHRQQQISSAGYQQQQQGSSERLPAIDSHLDPGTANNADSVPSDNTIHHPKPPPLSNKFHSNSQEAIIAASSDTAAIMQVPATHLARQQQGQTHVDTMPVNEALSPGASNGGHPRQALSQSFKQQESQGEIARPLNQPMHPTGQMQPAQLPKSGLSMDPANTSTQQVPSSSLPNLQASQSPPVVPGSDKANATQLANLEESASAATPKIPVMAAAKAADSHQDPRCIPGASSQISKLELPKTSSAAESLLEKGQADAPSNLCCRAEDAGAASQHEAPKVNQMPRLPANADNGRPISTLMAAKASQQQPNVAPQPSQKSSRQGSASFNLTSAVREHPKPDLARPQSNGGPGPKPANKSILKPGSSMLASCRAQDPSPETLLTIIRHWNG